MNSHNDAACLWPLAAELGEGPVWSAAEQALWFVDIKRCKLHRYDPASDETRSWTAPAQPGFLAPAAGGGFVVGLKTGLTRFEPTTGVFTPFLAVEPDRPQNRLNDGIADQFGRLWFGSMDDGERQSSGRIFGWDKQHGLRCWADGIAITNGPVLSPDGNHFYFTDTLARTIFQCRVGPDGALGERRVFAQFTAADGYPDGSCVDAEGCLWVAFWGGWGLLRLSPTGERLEQIKLPVAQVTKAAFGGPDLRTLYVTSARKGLSAAALAEQPLAGGLFAIAVDVPGMTSGTVTLT